MSFDKWNLNIHALVLLNLLNYLRKRDKMLGKPPILSFPKLVSIKDEHSYKILYIILSLIIVVYLSVITML